MNEKGLVGIVILVVVVILIISGGILFFWYKTRPPAYVSYGNEAIKENNLSICLGLDEIPNTYPMDCWKYVASQGKNIDLCNPIDSEIERYNCYTGFIYTKENLEECDFLSGVEKDFCIRVLASVKKDVQLCNLISDSREKTTCETNLFVDSVSDDVSCADSDKGIVEEIFGVVVDKNDNAVYSDQCLGTSLIEHYCEDGSHKQKEIDCGCNEGVCV